MLSANPDGLECKHCQVDGKPFGAMAMPSYGVEDLVYMSYLFVPFGSPRDIRLELGETVVICPATGGFGAAGVQVAIAMGARVIAIGRNEQELARLKTRISKGSSTPHVDTAKITGDEGKNAAALHAFGTIDAVLDLSPPSAAKSPHFNSAILAPSSQRLH
ncbi:uncharacterized protein Z519_11864 [Cladophialophora bantiana CBS 173.52]|uniref:Alcohol dehydrogenase-like C-terminal domain-containing protein n=1 Tax=Cladophialophora bantiana (strain ATCC 10958 / CBS 173.52 / CDC B-1940 / NIH 8579) TaxID=1442370 RepID=A0A0D2H9L2_CLAB1|nr:uncharacterized protein Z519_11864 [Cladophialophora bantiana CBS 173.52]KIW87540.1 hypothetical protein Z519_11864 [Cladophialophora bantiana CBS 173.52]